MDEDDDQKDQNAGDGTKKAVVSIEWLNHRRQPAPPVPRLGEAPAAKKIPNQQQASCSFVVKFKIVSK
jgi:hypothetical protein